MKTLVVTLEGPGGMEWSMPFADIAAARVKSFAESREWTDPATPDYKRLVEFSQREAEVVDWARRMLAPERLRNSWFSCKIEVVEGEEAREVKPGHVATDATAEPVPEKPKRKYVRKAQPAVESNASVA